MASPHRRVLWLDASAGVAGDMLLGALVDAGADRKAVRDAVRAVAPEVDVAWEPATRAGFRALRARVSTHASSPERDYAAIHDLIGRAGLPAALTADAQRVFAGLVEAEGRVHAVPAGEVHVHEVGAWDSIADVVGTCAALTDLAVDEIVVSRFAIGAGRVRSEHGDLPVPPPVVAELLMGWEVAGGGDTELATPTGVALATILASSQGSLPSGRLVAAGVGAGTRDTPHRANVVRAVLLEVDAAPVGRVEQLVELTATVDDQDPRVWPAVLDRLLAEGALDAWLVPVLMKKGRPAHALHVLAPPDDGDRLGELVLRHTTTLGYRSASVSRVSLERGWADVAVGGGRVPVKVASTAGRVVRAVPEYDECAVLAADLGIPVTALLDEARHAAANAGLVPGAAVPPAVRPSRHQDA